MRRILSSGVIAVLIYTACASVLSPSSTLAATKNNQTGDIIAYVNLDGPVIAVREHDISNAVNAAQAFTLQDDTTGKLSKAQIKQLAKEEGLLKETTFNPHLSFLDGDIAYWEEQQLSLNRLRMEFAARKAILDAADKAKVIIADQGKLSWAAQQIMPQVLKKIAAQSTKGADKQK